MGSKKRGQVEKGRESSVTRARIFGHARRIGGRLVRPAAGETTALGTRPSGRLAPPGNVSDAGPVPLVGTWPRVPRARRRAVTSAGTGPRCGGGPAPPRATRTCGPVRARAHTHILERSGRRMARAGRSGRRLAPEMITCVSCVAKAHASRVL